MHGVSGVITWKPAPSSFGGNGEVAYLGKVKVACAGWNLVQSQSDGAECAYSGQVLLPGFKSEMVRVKRASIDAVKIEIGRMVAEWCTWVGWPDESSDTAPDATEKANEREACARLLEVSRADLLLMAGEMTAQEVRTTQAVLAAKARAIRSRAD